MLEVDEIRGSAPAMTTKEAIQEIRSDVREVRDAVRLLTAADLSSRVTTIESWKDQLTGKLIASAVAIGCAFTLLGLVLDHLVLGS